MSESEGNRNFVFFYTYESYQRQVNGIIFFEKEITFPSYDVIVDGIACCETVCNDRIMITGWKEMPKDDFLSFLPASIKG